MWDKCLKGKEWEKSLKIVLKISVRYEESMTPSGVSTRVGGCSRVMDDVKVRECGGAVSYIYFGTNEES